MSAMTAVDIVLLVIGAFFVVRGIMKGLSGEVFSLVGTVGGFICSIRFYEPLADILIERFGATVPVATMISMFAIFFVIFLGCSLLDTVIKKVIKTTNLTFTDKFFGAAVGVIKTYLLALIVLVAGAITAPIAGDAWMKNSSVLSATAVTWPFVRPLLENAGLMPDIAAIQESAREYIIQHAEGALSGANNDPAPDTDPGAPETPPQRDTDHNVTL